MIAPTAADVEALLYRHDPMGLAALGAPEDEYEPEARTITPRLPVAKNEGDVHQILIEEFNSWFQTDTAPPAAALSAPARELWALLS